MPEPGAVSFATASPDGRPTARTVLLKRVEPDALIFTSALWTRKAIEIKANPHVALLSTGLRSDAGSTSSAKLCSPSVSLASSCSTSVRSHRIRALVSRQGQPIDSVEPLRSRHAHLMAAMEAPPECPPDWGTLRVRPEAVEFWTQAPDRLRDAPAL